MKRAVFTIVALLTALSFSAQEAVRFSSPFDFPLLLSANFGELRAGHFHGGIDIKTQSTIGWPVHSVADGYISRATVSAGGYGNGLYITHPNGYTTVYGHLDAFSFICGSNSRTTGSGLTSDSSSTTITSYSSRERSCSDRDVRQRRMSSGGRLYVGMMYESFIASERGGRGGGR